ncbi:hypothetical protein FVEN_g994 [Fusarium venenatum]|uniref:S-adenosyl-L-methionine-dependent methyltransferase n=1 Tax=Fusarium venenatum TaxID=56646 RepID=UPI001D7F30B9|nr:hypothetical protein FVEN_g994 [Fusarium venenatum]KAH6967182.1 S-adenosyl-L-methionine-dependent methyltransferase [Fusarium venenatum]
MTQSTEPTSQDGRMTTSNAPQPTASVVLPEPQHWARMGETAEANNDELETTEVSDGDSTLASITSSILQYRTIHGRTYHSEQGNAQYWGSNDKQQNDLMDLTHHILTLGLGDKLHLAPVIKHDVKNVIDIGTGTGIWAIDFADQYPEAQIIGTDLSPIQPSWIPPNLQFIIEDCTWDWSFTSGFADYIHARWLMGSIRNWDSFFSEAFRVSKPGGWVESHEAASTISSDDNTVPPDSAMGHWGKFFIEGSKKIGTSFTVVEDGMQRKAMEKAGFVNIQEFDFRNPIGNWPDDPVEKQMGSYTKHGLETDSEGFVLFMAHTLGWSREDILAYVTQFKREIRSGKYHGYFAQKVVWGQKPN